MGQFRRQAFLFAGEVGLETGRLLAENSIFVMNGKNKMKLGERCKDWSLHDKCMVIHFSNTNNTMLHGEGRRVSASPFKFGVSRILFPEGLRH